MPTISNASDNHRNRRTAQPPSRASRLGLDFDYATGEDVEGAMPPRQAELMHFQDLAAKLREFGEGLDGEIVPSSISARHKRHLATGVIRAYQSLCDDLTALVGVAGRGRAART